MSFEAWRWGSIPALMWVMGPSLPGGEIPAMRWTARLPQACAVCSGGGGVRLCHQLCPPSILRMHALGAPVDDRRVSALTG